MLGKIEKVELREIWKHEAIDFTNWLAESDNFKLLAEEIGLDMQVLKTEANVGGFSADILAEELNTGKKIIIENQLEETDHKHLGQIITYASGLEANYIIWIFKKMRDEHRKAIDWLNEITDEDLSIFAIQMELWKIGDSNPAPKFNVICSPNDWAKAYKKASGSGNLSDNNLTQLNFWEGFVDYCSQHKNPFKGKRTARPQHWYNVSIGNSHVELSLEIIIKNSLMRVSLYIPDNKQLYKELESKKSEIESAFGDTLDWKILEGKKASRIDFETGDIDIQNQENYADAYKCLLDNAIKLYNAVKKYIK
ncbi:MAG: DUF4268 domain-containing protein [Culturomica sp.]|jgi:hypothetical protein|nr:DUF4268 domain-containing protein [Culturomica sp.]